MFVRLGLKSFLLTIFLACYENSQITEKHSFITLGPDDAKELVQQTIQQDLKVSRAGVNPVFLLFLGIFSHFKWCGHYRNNRSKQRLFKSAFF